MIRYRSNRRPGEMVRDRSSFVNPVEGNDPTILFDLWLAARACIALLDEALADAGLDAEDFAVYSVIRKGDGISPSELASWMSAPATTVSSMVKRLQDRGHIRKA